jgi:hypothetical protein
MCRPSGRFARGDVTSAVILGRAKREPRIQQWRAEFLDPRVKPEDDAHGYVALVNPLQSGARAEGPETMILLGPRVAAKAAPEDDARGYVALIRHPRPCGAEDPVKNRRAWWHFSGSSGRRCAAPEDDRNLGAAGELRRSRRLLLSSFATEQFRVR